MLPHSIRQTGGLSSSASHRPRPALFLKINRKSHQEALRLTSTWFVCIAIRGRVD